MPFYRVWYRNNPEPLEFSSASRCGEQEILDRIFTHEQIVPIAIPDATGNGPAMKAPTVRELVENNHLPPVRYTEDEGEMQSIG